MSGIFCIFTQHPICRDPYCVCSDARPSHAQAGPKVLDFGKVCVTSKNVKNFSVSNGLEQYVLANVAFAAVPELAERSTPPGQVCETAAAASQPEILERVGLEFVLGIWRRASWVNKVSKSKYFFSSSVMVRQFLRVL